MPTLPKNIESHDFYCLNCGKKNAPLFRKRGRLREHNHRQVLYCPYCRETVNHIECRNYAEVIDFKEAFEIGAFKEEAKVSIEYVKGVDIYE